MSLPKIKDFNDFNHYPSDPQPTTDADMQDYMQNQNDILNALTKRLWQPQTEYKLGDIVASDAMADGLVAVCTIAGVTSDIEPEWGVNEATVIDNSCTWIMRPAYCYGLATENDVDTAYEGGEAEVSRLLSLGVVGKIFSLLKSFTDEKIKDLFGESNILPIVNGGTGATSAENARTNLGIDNIITTRKGITPISVGQAGTPTGTYKLVIKAVNADNDDVPNNGILLEYGGTTRAGQLFFSDNDYTGVWFNGWSNGVRGEWKRLAWISDVTASKTNGIVEQSSKHVKFANGFLLMFYQFSGGGVKTVYPNSASYWASVDTGAGGFNPGVTRVNSTQVNIQNVRSDTSTWCIGMGWA